MFFIVLFTPKELLSKNIRKSQHILKVSVPSEITFDNTKVIKQCLETIEKSQDKEEKADKYFQIGKWYKEMDDFKSSFQSYVQGIECFPTHYAYLKKIIREALMQDLDKKAFKYSMQLFEIEPKNPTVPQNLINIYFDSKKQDLLIKFFTYSIAKHNQSEILGNLNFHLGLLYLNIGIEDKADKYIKISKGHFEAILPKNHQIFKTIKDF